MTEQWEIITEMELGSRLTNIAATKHTHFLY